MRNLFFILPFLFLFLFETAAFAVLENGPVIGQGVMGQTITSPPSQIGLSNLGTVFSLYAGDHTAVLTSDKFYPFYKNGVAYSVSAGKTASCWNITVSSSLTLAAYQFVASSAVFAFNAAAITTTGMPAGFGSFQCGATSKYCRLTGATVNVPAMIDGFYSFGAGTFPGFQPFNGQTYEFNMSCIEK